jgi:hypothetical protein
MKDIDDFEELPDDEGPTDPGGGGGPTTPPSSDDGGFDTPPDDDGSDTPPDDRTEAERAIDAKHRVLDRTGHGLGAPRTDVEAAGHGGRVRKFERGHIYWHPATGAHEVHGGILRAYLTRGGPGRNPKTDRRDLKFPTSDEVRSADGRTPVSHFEGGSIYWVDGVGGVAIYGDIEAQWRRMGAEQGWLGHPLSDPHERGAVEAAFFEHGCLWSGPGSGGRVRSYRFHARPLDGRQTVVDPDDPADLVFSSPLVTTVPDATVPDAPEVNAALAPREPRDVPEGPFDPTDPTGPTGPSDPGTTGPPIPPLDPTDLEAVDPEVERGVRGSGRSIWSDALVLADADGGARSVPLAVEYGGATLVDLDGTVAFGHDLRVADPSRLEPGTAYDVRLRTPNGRRVPLFTDAVLAKSDASAERSDIAFVDDEIDVVGRVHLRRRRDAPETLLLDTEAGNVVLGGDERDGDVRMRDRTDTERIHLDTGPPTAVDREHVRVYVDGREGTISLGADGAAGTVAVRDGDGDPRLVLDGGAGDVRLDLAGDGATESLGDVIRDLERRLADLEG